MLADYFVVVVVVAVVVVFTLLCQSIDTEVKYITGEACWQTVLLVCLFVCLSVCLFVLPWFVSQSLLKSHTSLEKRVFQIC